jgi:hypothetical protein
MTSAGRAIGQIGFLEENRVYSTQRQVPQDASSGSATADDYNLRLLHW